MSMEECMEALLLHADVSPAITSTGWSLLLLPFASLLPSFYVIKDSWRCCHLRSVWKELEKENQEFFRAYRRVPPLSVGQRRRGSQIVAYDLRVKIPRSFKGSSLSLVGFLASSVLPILPRLRPFGDRNMEPLCRTAHRHPFHLPLFPKPLLSSPPFLKPFLCSSSPKLCPSLRASCSSKSSSNSLAPVIKIASVAAATSIAAAAFFLARLCPPALAAAPPAPAVQSDALPSDGSSETTPLTEAEKERILEERLASHPDDVRSLRALMELKVKAGRLVDAIGIVDRLIALEPAEKDLPLLKSHLQSYDGDTETAKRGFEELLEKDPFLVEAYHGLVMATSQSEDDGDLDAILKRVEDAMELCKKARRKEDLRDFKLLMAQIKVIEGKYEDSLKIYQELVKEEPRDFRPYLCQGIIYTLLRKKDEAEKQFQKYRRLVPKGHPYAQYFDDNMIAMKVFGQMDENRRKAALKN
ncbi:hypothetical protein B296_00010938 [Ensete ventricosum]|uniref:Uncharacterized protein n=1 Tax=Ensete ventricosum TaxID=4639 RepID=A0A427ASW3_ENSVE|nr:hypothetical protein B296_00010938 [Ensete ventricosum]